MRLGRLKLAATHVKQFPHWKLIEKQASCYLDCTIYIIHFFREYAMHDYDHC